MGEQTKIAWCTSTYNMWLGCSKVSVSAPDGDTSKGGACDNCYAEELDRVRFSKTLGGGTKTIPISHWGPGAPRHRTSESTRNAPHKWNKAREIAMGEFALGKRPKPEPHRVFCASLADVFDNEAPQAWRDDLWNLIAATRYLDWLLVTKRIGNVRGMVDPRWIEHGFPNNVRLLISVSNQFEADRDIPKLLAIPAKNGISYEPALGPIDFNGRCVSIPWGGGSSRGGRDYSLVLNCLGWVIFGGESTQGARQGRPCDIEWAFSMRDQCKAAGVPFFMKQVGSNPWWGGVLGRTKHRAGADPAEWPAELQVQEFP